MTATANKPMPPFRRVVRLTWRIAVYGAVPAATAVAVTPALWARACVARRLRRR